jgi:hypothetical protein
MTAFNVYKGRKLIDTVFYSGNTEAADDVKKSLINHDGYDSDIRVTKARGKPTTEVQHVIQGHYGHGWEDLTASLDYKEAKADLKAYRLNDPGTNTRLIKRRVKIETE